MAVLRNGAEGGVNNTQVSPTNGGGSGNAWDLVSIAGSSNITYSTDFAQKGSLSYKFTTNAQDAQYLEWLPTAANSAVGRCYFYMTGLPTNALPLIGIRTAGGGTPLASILIKATGLLDIQGAAGTDLYTSAISLAINTWYRLEWSFTNPSTTTGACVVKVYTGDSTTEITGVGSSLTAQNFGASLMGQVRIGRWSGFGTLANFYVDDIAWQDSTTTLLGPSVANIAPTVTTTNQTVAVGATVTMSATGSDSDGSIANYTWTPPAGVTLSSTTTSNPTWVPTVGGVYTFTVTATDNGGATSSAATSVVKVTDSSARPYTVVSNAGAWTASSGTIQATLADESDASYTLTPAAPAGAAIVLGETPLTPGNPVTVKTRNSLDVAGTNITRLIELLQGATVIASKTITLNSATASDDSFTTTGAQTANITDYTALTVRITDTQ